MSVINDDILLSARESVIIFMCYCISVLNIILISF